MTTVTPLLKLPDALLSWQAEVRHALETPLLAEWPKDTKITDAKQPAAVGEVLINACHPHLERARIAYLFRETMARGEQVRLATASKASAKLAFLAHVDFVIDVNWMAWRGLTPGQRLALIDHELCHCGRDMEKDDGWVLLHHDIEEFAGIVGRWGLWQPDLVRFDAVLRRAPQLHLFEEPA